MAVTGLDFSFSTIQQCNHDPGFTLMDRQSIDLNKHAIDLNEVPLNDFNLDIYDASAARGVGSSLLPKKGGWLELFRNMFGHDKAALDGFLFGSRSSNNVSLAKGKMHRDPRICSTGAVNNGHIGSSADQNLDMAQQSVARKIGSPSQHGKHRRPSKLPIFNEFNHKNISAPPITECVGMSDKPSYNATLGQCGFEKDFLSSISSSHKQLNCSGGVRQHPLDAVGQHPYSNGLHAPFNLVLGQASTGSCTAPGLNYSQPPLPLWDLNSQPGSSWSPELHRVGLSKSGSHCFTQHSLKHFFSAEAQMMQNVEGSCAPPVNPRQEDGFSEREKDSRALSPLKKDALLCLQKQNSCGSYRAKVLESDDGGMLPFVNGKGLNQRIRIIASPDWLPAGWITEVKTRMAGSTAGTTDKYYKDPVTGRRFRSKNEVLSFLQTGRVCRNKPQARLLEGFPSVTNMPLLLPMQEERVVLCDVFQAVATKHTCLTPAMDRTSQASICHSIYPPNVFGGGVSVKQEPDDMTQDGLKSCRDNRVSDVTSLAESSAYNLQERCELEVPEIEKGDSSVRTDPPSIRTEPPARTESTSGRMFHEPVHSNKRKSLDDGYSRLPTKFLRTKVEELRNQDKWIFGMSPFRREGEPPAVSSEVEPMDTKIAHAGYPGLLYKKETIEAQDTAVSQYLAARYRANAKALGLPLAPLISSTVQVKGGCVKDLHPTPGFLYKGGEKKAPKLTLKQERDLFISLGRKLCREVLAPEKESCLQQAEKSL